MLSSFQQYLQLYPLILDFNLKFMFFTVAIMESLSKLAELHPPLTPEMHSMMILPFEPNFRTLWHVWTHCNSYCFYHGKGSEGDQHCWKSKHFGLSGILVISMPWCQAYPMPYNLVLVWDNPIKSALLIFLHGGITNNIYSVLGMISIEQLFGQL